MSHLHDPKRRRNLGKEDLWDALLFLLLVGIITSIAVACGLS